MTDDSNPEDKGGGNPSGDNPQSGDQPQGDKTFTQDELNRIVGERLAKERGKFEGFDDFKHKADEFDKLQQEQLSEVEKLKGQLEAEQKKTESLNQKLQEQTVSIAIRDAAQAEGFKYPSAIVRLIDSGSLQFEDDGSPKSDSVKQALKQVSDEFPDLKGTKSSGDPDGGVRPPANREPAPGHDTLVAAFEAKGES